MKAEAILAAAAMLKVAVTRHDEAVESVRKMIAYFFTEVTGILSRERS